MSDEPTKSNEWDNQIWLNSKDKYHRNNDLPIVTWPDGSTCFWAQNNQWHREKDLPAIVCSDGYCEWWENGKRHRENDLPALIWPDGKCEWWVNDKFIKAAQCTLEEIEEYKKPYKK